MNKPLLRPLALAGFTLALTLLISSALPFFTLILIGALAAGLSVGLGILHFLDKVRSKILLVFVLCLMTALCISMADRSSLLRTAPYAGNQIEFSGEVRKIWRGDSVCYLVETESGSLPAGTPVLVYAGTEEYIPGDRISGTVSLWENPPSRSQLARGGNLCGYAASENLQLEQEAGGIDLWFWSIKEHLRTDFYRIFPRNTAEFLIALFTGDDSALSDSMTRTFSALGISHVLCVSGLHISLLTAAIGWLFSHLWGKGKLSFWLSALVAGAFVLFTGGENSAVRAYVMAVLSMSARFLCRDYSPSNALGGAMILLCLLNPRSAVSTGFWMSVLASAAIFSLTPSWKEQLWEKLPQRLQNRFSRRILVSLCTTAAANLACMPVFFLWFGSMPWKFFLPNLILVPLLPIIIGISCLCLLPGMTWLGKLVGFVLEPLFQLFSRMAQGNSYLPLQFGWLYIWAVGSVLLLILSYWKGQAKHRRLAVSLSVFLLASGSLTGWIAGRNVLSVSVISSGSGQSIVLSKNGQSVVIGCGGSNQIARKTASFLRSTGNSSLTALIVPEETAFLMEGMAELSREIPPEQILSDAESNWYQTLSDMGLSINPLAEGEYLLWEDCRLVISQNREKPDIGIFSENGNLLFQSEELPVPQNNWDGNFFYDEIYKKDSFSISGYAIIKAAQWRIPPEFLEGVPLFGEYFAAEEQFWFPSP